MTHLKITIPVPEGETRDMLLAMLTAIGFEAFEEEEERLIAFMPGEGFNEEALRTALGAFDLSYEKEELAEQNWNRSWESSFEPVLVGGFAGIRAHFHPPLSSVQHEIIITPQMSFGTGHHETTWLMVQAMSELDFSGRTVIDFGTGTGILAILAEKLGAAEVQAIDIDEWSIANATDNAARNQCSRIRITQAENLSALGIADILLANINKHIILQHLPAMRKHLKENGKLLLSGLLRDDEADISKALTESGFRHERTDTRGNWICLLAT